MSDSQQRSNRPADDVFFNQDEDVDRGRRPQPTSPTYRQPTNSQSADTHHNGRTFGVQPRIAGNLYRPDRDDNSHYDSDPYLSDGVIGPWPTFQPQPSTPTVPLDKTQPLPVQPAVPSTPPAAPNTPAPATPNQAQPPISPTADDDKAKADDKDGKKKRKSLLARMLRKPFAVVGRLAKKVRRNDGLARTAHCKRAKFYWLVIWVVIPTAMYFLTRSYLSSQEASTGIAAHNPVANYYAHRQIERHVSNWGPATIIVAIIISIVLMTLVRYWDLKRHFGSAMTTNGDGTLRPQLAIPGTNQIGANRVAHRKAVRRRQFTLLLLVLAIPVTIHLLGQFQ